MPNDRATFCTSLLSLLSEILAIPFLGKIAVALLVLIPLVLVVLLIIAPPWVPEQQTEGIITWIPEHTTLARYVHYEYSVDGKKYERRMQWVNLEREKNIRVGQRIKVFYHPADPRTSRTEIEPSGATFFYGLLLSWFVLTSLLIIWAKERARRAQSGLRVSQNPVLQFFRTVVTWLFTIACLAGGYKIVQDQRIPAQSPDSVPIEGTTALAIGYLVILLGAGLLIRNIAAIRKRGSFF